MNGTAVLTPDLLTAITGIIISLACSYIPGLAPRWDQLEAVKKRLIMLGLLALSALGIVGVSCSGLVPMVACTQSGAVAVTEAFLVALIANQSAFLITKG